MQKGLFPRQICEKYVVRRTISFCNKELQVSCWRKLGGMFQMLCYGSVECELFRFQLMSINYEIVLTH